MMLQQLSVALLSAQALSFLQQVAERECRAARRSRDIDIVCRRYRPEREAVLSMIRS